MAATRTPLRTTPRTGASSRHPRPTRHGGSSSGRPLGGIILDKSATLLGEALPRIDAVVFDPVREVVVLLGEERAGLPGIRLGDMVMAQWLAHQRQARISRWTPPTLSIRPAPG